MGAGSEDSAEDGSVDNELEDRGAEPSTDKSSLEEKVQPPGGEVSSTRVRCAILEADPADLRKWQQEDHSLETVRQVATDQAKRAEDRVRFVYWEGLLRPLWRPEGISPGHVRSCEQLVLPQRCCSFVLRLAHNIPLAGHFDIKKIRECVLQHYYWPEIFSDVATYCHTCEVYQRSQSRHPTKATMVSMPLISKPFQQIAKDFVGPLPRTRKGNRFILTLCDYAMLYLEAIEASRIAKELVAVFVRVGVP